MASQTPQSNSTQKQVQQTRRIGGSSRSECTIPARDIDAWREKP